ncbi:MAG: hypothetical protein WD751_00410 [Anaerolineales bacterium]
MVGNFWLFWGNIIWHSLLSVYFNLGDILGISIATIVLAGLLWLIVDLWKFKLRGFSIWWGEMKTIYDKKLEDRAARYTLIAIAILITVYYLIPFYTLPFRGFMDAQATMLVQANEIDSLNTEVALTTKEPTDTTSAFTPTATLTITPTDLAAVEQDKLEILELINKFLNDLNQERLPNDWDLYLTNEYSGLYKTIYGGEDGISRAFFGKDRHVFQFGVFDWENQGKAAIVPVIIRFGYGTDFVEEDFFFHVTWNNNINHWTITSDQLTSIPSTPTPTK